MNRSASQVVSETSECDRVIKAIRDSDPYIRVVGFDTEWKDRPLTAKEAEERAARNARRAALKAERDAAAAIKDQQLKEKEARKERFEAKRSQHKSIAAEMSDSVSTPISVVVAPADEPNTSPTDIKQPKPKRLPRTPPGSTGGDKKSGGKGSTTLAVPSGSGSVSSAVPTPVIHPYQPQSGGDDSPDGSPVASPGLSPAPSPGLSPSPSPARTPPLSSPAAAPVPPPIKLAGSSTDSPAATGSVETETPVAKRVKSQVAVIQLAFRSVTVIVQIHLMRGVSIELKRLLEDPAILKTGVECAKDGRKCFDDYGFDVRGCIDLNHVLRRSTIPASALPAVKGGNNWLGLHAICTAVLGVGLNKDYKVRCGDWDSPVLETIQILYGAAEYVRTINAMIG